jgi:hypothetical protein
VIQANPVVPVDQAPVSLTQANRIRANRIPVSLNRVNRIRRAEASRTQAIPVTVIPTVPATRDHPVAVTPARAIRVVAVVVNPTVRIVNQPARKATANRKVNLIRKIQAAKVTRYRAIRGQAIRSQVTPVVAVPLRRVIPVKAKAVATQQATRRASPQVGQTVNRDPKANHRAEIVRRVGRVAIDQVTAKATACHGQQVTQPVVLLVIRKAIQAADRQAPLIVILRHQPAIREIHQPVTQMNRQQVIPQIHPRANRIAQA